ncbi:hypothetical protein [Paraglaciecola hydrolytica]|uniref:Uncharacterized protein n=1 Tax=Paraglaciecola hydrolytica TaxID=1799789 RepID=A0A136A4I6_9ALTE|nr:hypothetical protein [Paraglaciecola hydrolytica]KXI30158.1 hypothetical protein AX660_09205 [Paraglaciecola hydrolytica]
MKWLQNFANQTDKRWAEFKFGLGIFVIGALLILAGARWWMYLQIPAVILLLIGGGYAAKGYFGILLYRLTSNFQKAKPPAEFDKDK